MYIMVPPTTPRATCTTLLAGLHSALDAFVKDKEKYGADVRDGYIV